MRKSAMARLSALLAVGAISLPLLWGTTSALAASPRATPPIGRQLAQLKSSDAVAQSYFGYSVAISGTTAIVGAPAPNGYPVGRACVFTKTAEAWKLAAELEGSDTIAGINFGFAVAISGTTVVVGEPLADDDAGRAYVFTERAGGWKQVAELKGSDTVGVHSHLTGDEFGTSVAISGTTAVVGAYDHADGAGRAYVFTKRSRGWKQVAELKGSDTVANDQFGTSVAVSGTTVVVGAEDHARSAGRAYVFTKRAGSWKQVAELKGDDTVARDYFGYSVAISENTAIVGSYNHADAGRAYVFTKRSGRWEQVAELSGSDTAAGDYFGYSVAVSGTTIVVGAQDHARSAGRAYVFTKRSGRWKQVAELKGSGTGAHDYFGYSVAVSGTTAVVGADGYARQAGRAYVFEA